MDSKEKKLVALSDADRMRLERLAALAQTTPEELWPAVERCGFEDVEDSILADLEAQADHQAGRTIPNEEVMKRAEQLVLRNGQQPKRRAG